MSWNVTGLTNHQQVEWKTRDPSQSVAKFTKTAGKRPDTLFKLKAGKVEIRTGARVTRHRGTWSSFKSKLSKILHTITPKSLFKSAKANRAHRHAEYNRDEAVNKLVANIANGKMDPAKLGKQMVNLSRLNQRLATAHPTARPDPTPNQPATYSEKEVRDLVDAQFETTMRESIQTALRANPDKADEIADNLRKAFSTQALTPEQRSRGNITLDDVRRDDTASVGLKVLDDEIYKFKTSVEGVREVMKHNDPGKVTMQQSRALARFAASALGKKGGRSEEETFALNFLKQHIKPGVAGAGGDANAKRLLGRLDSEHLNMLGKATYSAKGSERNNPGANTALFNAVKSNLAEDLRGFMAHVQPGGGQEGLREAWVNEVIVHACTAKKADGDPLHSDETLNAHFESVYKEELPNQNSKSSYFRRNEGSVGFIKGLLERYGEGKLEALGEAAGQHIVDRLKVAGDPPHPSAVTGAIRESLQMIADGSADITNPKLDGFLKKVHDEFKAAGDNGNDVIKGEAVKFTRSVAFLRNLTPAMTKTVLDSKLPPGQLSAGTGVVSALVQSFGNGTPMTKIRDKAQGYAKLFVRKTEQQIDKQLAKDIKASQTSGPGKDGKPKLTPYELRENAHQAKLEARQVGRDFVNDILSLYKQQFPSDQGDIAEPKSFEPSMAPSNRPSVDVHDDDEKEDIIILDGKKIVQDNQVLDDEQVLDDGMDITAGSGDRDETKEDINTDLDIGGRQGGNQPTRISQFYANVVNLDLEVELDMKLKPKDDLFPENEATEPFFRFDDLGKVPESRRSSDVDIDYTDRLNRD